jgi:hypothetical protein
MESVNMLNIMSIDHRPFSIHTELPPSHQLPYHSDTTYLDEHDRPPTGYADLVADASMTLVDPEYTSYCHYSN